MFPHRFQITITIIGICISRTGTIKYIKDIIWGGTKPHIYTWVLRFITQSIGVLGMRQWGGGLWVRWPTIGLIGLGIVIGLSIKHWTKNITTFDTTLLVWWLLAVCLWWLTNNPLWSVILVSLIDTIWYIPSFRKTFLDPHSETLISWIWYCIANICVIFALAEYNLLTLLYIGMILLCNLCMVMIIVSRRKI